MAPLEVRDMARSGRAHQRWWRAPRGRELFHAYYLGNVCYENQVRVRTIRTKIWARVLLSFPWIKIMWLILEFSLFAPSLK